MRKFWENLSWICDDVKKCNVTNGAYCVRYGNEFECRCENGFFGGDCEYCKSLLISILW